MLEGWVGDLDEHQNTCLSLLGVVHLSQGISGESAQARHFSSNMCSAHVEHHDGLQPVIDGGYYAFNSSGFTTFPTVPGNFNS